MIYPATRMWLFIFRRHVGSTLEQIGAELGITRQAVWDRTKTLQALGLIKRHGFGKGSVRVEITPAGVELLVCPTCCRELALSEPTLASALAEVDAAGKTLDLARASIVRHFGGP